MFILNIKTSIIFEDKLISHNLCDHKDILDITIDININLISEISYNRYSSKNNTFHYYKLIMSNKNEYIISLEEYNNTILPALKVVI